MPSHSQSHVLRLIGAAVVCAPLALSCFARTPVPVAHVEKRDPAGIWAQLHGTLNASKVKPTDLLLARTTFAWESDGCKLRKGAILKGHALKAVVKSADSAVSEVALRFEADCGGGKTQPLILIAVLRAYDPGDPQSDSALHNSLPQMIHGGGRSISEIANTMADMGSDDSLGDLPVNVTTGEVWGLAKMKLSVATGPERSSVLSTPAKNLHLAYDSNFVFFPDPGTVTSEGTDHPGATAGSDSGNAASPDTSSSAASPGTNPAADIKKILAAQVVDETEVCAPPACNDALPVSPEAETMHAKASFSVADLGYAPRLTRELGALDHDAAITYTGDHELLFTFNPHVLVNRADPKQLDPADDGAHVMRAALIDLDTMHVKHTVEWRVRDANQFVWRAGRDRIMVHVGSTLRVYGPGLKLLKTVPLDGPLAFVQPSPSGNYFAVGVVRERHSWDVHRRLAEIDSREPEEDVEVNVWDDHFHPIGSVMRHSSDQLPVMTDAGEIRGVSAGRNLWRMQEDGWSKGSRKIADVGSACGVRTRVLSSDLLFLEGCNWHTAQAWYRVIRMNGRPVLKGSTTPLDLHSSAQSSDSGDAFAVAFAQTSRIIPSGVPFHGTDLTSESITVYQSSNGRRIFGLKLVAPAPSEQSYALSPAGDQLVVLHGSQISVYSLPHSEHLAEAAPKPSPGQLP
jgi:hypothetical protein